MEKIRREEIRIIAKNSNWSASSISQTLQEKVYSKSEDWLKFLKVFFLGLGVTFTVAGIIFFFSYNWDALHKFVKLGLIGALFVATTLTAVLIALNPLVKKALLTASAILVGVFLAVFGQVYQTGANAYDLFLNWTLLVALWVVVINFAPLWTVFVTLINITIILYSEQVAHGWSDVFLHTLLFWVNSLILILFILGPVWIKKAGAPSWFTHLIALAAVIYATMGTCVGIFDTPETSFYLLMFTGTMLYAAGAWYGLQAQSAFYLSIIGFSLIIICSAFLIKLSEDAGMFLFLSLFIIASVTALIMMLIKLHKKWNQQTG
ncbi:DUF2157 domain-containing protein [Flagellimonas myxillae]|uniref:DUF2157 domain-containing protein n=1 Tax=Flagellimonas myxillae TaxID=2942214 RepID=UPI00201E7DA5|nr:DUF2157 domain-containing protein [Muricauda myxillae]MCL6266606.1 DUF2157 domain-containing protein [Muricauda myxillae]